MNLIYHLLEEISYLDSQIKERQERLQHGADAWKEGTDCYEMAGCDPSDQFIIGEEIEQLQFDRHRFVIQLKEAVEELN